MEYKSDAALFGLPLVHVFIGASSDSGYRRGVATGWIAIGDVAVGVVALGGGALGVVAIGGAAFAWHAAIGGLAIAHEFALGGLAIGAHVVRPPP